MSSSLVLSAVQLLPERVGPLRETGSRAVSPNNPALFREIGFVYAEAADYQAPGRKAAITAYRMNDTTGALAAWEWLRSPDDHSCDIAPYCAENNERILLFDSNYVLEWRGSRPKKAELQALLSGLPERREGSLPPILSFIPRKDLVPNSARYILGPVSLARATNKLAQTKPGFESGAEAHYTSYTLHGQQPNLVLFYYPTPEMARLHTIDFKLVPGAIVKRSGVLVAVVLPGATQQEADSLLSQIEYEAKITWNEAQQGNPIPTLYRLLMNIIILSLILVLLCLTAGLMYGLMRLYRRRFGTLSEDEAMTTLHLGRE